MRKLLLTAATLFALGALPARAMPVAPLSDAPASVTPVAMGCGPGWTRGPYGHCHPIYGVVAPAPYYGGYYGYRPYAYRPYAYRRCWIGRWGYRHCAG